MSGTWGGISPGWNLYFNVYQPNLTAGRVVPIIGSELMVLVALLLVVAALFIGVDGWKAFQRYLARPVTAPGPAPAR